MTEERAPISIRINDLLARADLKPLDPQLVVRFEDYLSLILRWSARTNLTAVRDNEGIIARHFVESIACAYALPGEVTTLLDFGSGAGFPGVPIALCRPGIAVTLAESQGKKAAFLREAVRVLGISVKIYAERAETLSTRFDCVVLRAVDRMSQAAQEGARLVSSGGWLALMTTEGKLGKLKAAAGGGFSWAVPAALPGSENRVLALGQQSISLQH